MCDKFGDLLQISVLRGKSFLAIGDFNRDFKEVWRPDAPLQSSDTNNHFMGTYRVSSSSSLNSGTASPTTYWEQVSGLQVTTGRKDENR